MQIYFLGDDEAATRRKEKIIQFEKKDVSIGRKKRIEKILEILTNEMEDNELLETYERAVEVAESNDSEEVKIIWCAKERGAHHPKQYKEPDECLPAIITSKNYTKKNNREIVLHLKKKSLDKECPNEDGKNVSFINEFHRIYYASHYVLFFPGGQSSFGFYLPKRNGENEKFDFRAPNVCNRKRRKRCKTKVKDNLKNEQNMKPFVTCRAFYRYQFNKE